MAAPQRDREPIVTLLVATVLVAVVMAVALIVRTHRAGVAPEDTPERVAVTVPPPPPPVTVPVDAERVAL